MSRRMSTLIYPLRAGTYALDANMEPPGEFLSEVKYRWPDPGAFSSSETEAQQAGSTGLNPELTQVHSDPVLAESAVSPRIKWPWA